MDELILKYLQGEASNSESLQLLDWLRQNPENFSYYEEMRDAWFAAGILQAENESLINERYKKLHTRIQQSSAPSNTSLVSIRRFPQWLKIAAMLVVAFLVGALVSSYPNWMTKGTVDKPVVVEAPYGSKLKMSLADGTQLWLNAGSRLSYSADYNHANRHVELEGEAYFQVAKNKKLPFVVQARNVEVTALGTAFNLSAYADDNLLQATLVEGSIEVAENQEQVVLYPNQMITIDLQASLKGAMAYQIEKDINTKLYTSWTERRWIFDRENMLSFAKTIERRYDVEIIFAEESLKDYKISGSIEQQTLGQLLKALQLTLPIAYEIKDKEVVLSIDKNLKQEYKSLILKN